MIENKCPNCGNEVVEDTAEGTVMPNEIVQEFHCDNCDTTWDVTFAPIEIRHVKQVQPEQE